MSVERLTVALNSLGGSSGIGLATVNLLLAQGASVVNADIQAPAEEPQGSYTFVKTNVAVWAEQVALFKKAKEVYGRIDHVFANAGVGPRADYLSTEVDENGDPKEPSHLLLDVSLNGVINSATLAIFHMRQQPEGGSIVITGSTTGLQRLRAVDYGMFPLYLYLFPLLNCYSCCQARCAWYWKRSRPSAWCRQPAHPSQHSCAKLGRQQCPPRPQGSLGGHRGRTDARLCCCPWCSSPYG